MSLSEAKPGQKKRKQVPKQFLSISLKIYRHAACLCRFHLYLERHIDPQFSLLRQLSFLPRGHDASGVDC